MYFGKAQGKKAPTEPTTGGGAGKNLGGWGYRPLHTARCFTGGVVGHEQRLSAKFHRKSLIKTIISVK